MEKVYRQGDILFFEVKDLPEGLKVRENKIIAEGEATGHKHRLEETSDGLLFEDENGNLFLRSNVITTIIHEEHKPIALPKGNYKILRQKEYSPEGWREVRD